MQSSLCRQSFLRSIRGLALVAGLAIGSAPIFAQQQVALGDARIVADAATMNLDGVVAGDIVELNLPGDGADALPEDFTLTIPSSAWRETTIFLTKESVRSDNYQPMQQQADGSFLPLVPRAVRTYGGSIQGVEGTAARGSLLMNGFIGSIWAADGSRLIVQPLSDFQPGAPRNLHVVYRGEDTSCAGVCGNGPAQGFSQPIDPFGERGSCGGSICIAELGLDIDVAYINATSGGNGNSGAAQDRAEAVLNVMNHQYTTQINIAHRISTFIVRFAGSDPYAGTTNINTLLDTLRTDWNTNRPAAVRDIAHLFTGAPTGGTIGLAFIGVVCWPGNDFSYGVSQLPFSTAFGCQTDLLAHELGHNWNADHCTCPNSTMNPFITCTNTFLADSSAPGNPATIDAFRDSRTCLTSGGTVPLNNTCGNAFQITTSVVTGSSLGATTDGGVFGCGVGSGGQGAGENDVWYRFTAPSTGNVTIDTCGSAFDTVLAVFSDACPGGPDNLIVCDDDSSVCPQNFRSVVTFAAVQGQSYRVRVAGWSGATGNFTLTLSGPGTSVFGSNACASPLAITTGNYTGSFFAATNDVSAGACALTSTARDVWYSYTAPCASTLTVNTCGTHDWNGATDSGVDSVLSLYSTCGTVIICNDDTVAIPGCSQAGNQWDSLVSTTMTEGQTVLIRVAPRNDFYANGMFRLNVNATVCPPANDACSAATRILEDGTYFGTNVGATVDGAGSCEFAPSGDVYWLFTSPTTGTATVTTCGSNFDTVLSIHSACPATTANQVACNDQSAPGTCGAGFTDQSAVSFSAVQGATYLLRVAGWNGATGNITLNVDAPTRATADNCGGSSTLLTPGTTVVGSLYDNTASSAADSCGGTVTARDAWYRFTAATSGNLTISTCGSRAFTSNGVPGTDTVVSVFDSCSVAASACIDGGTCGGVTTAFDSVLTVPYTAGQTKFIRVAHYNFGDIPLWYGNGMFSINAQLSSVVCNDIDFNNDGGSFDPTDVDAFLSVFSEGPCIPVTATCDDIDFNNDGGFFDPCDVDSFLLVFSEGPCTSCGF